MLALLVGASALAGRPALAAGYDNVDGAHRPLGLAAIILIFAVVPVGLTVLLTAIFLRPGSAPGATRYRPGRPWDAPPVWFGEPSQIDPQQAALPAAERRELGIAAPSDAAAPGGARAHW